MSLLNFISPRGGTDDPKEDIRIGANTVSRRQQELFDFKAKLHEEVISKIDLDVLLKFDSDTARSEVARFIGALVNQTSFPLNLAEKQQIVKEVVDETFGLGPLEPLLEDPTIDEILVNNYQTVFIERGGKLQRTQIRFKDNTHLRHVINRIVARVGRRIDDSSPMIDARLPDGSRVNAVIPPLALDGPCLSIRRFKKIPLTTRDLVDFGTLSPEILFLLQVAVQAKINMVISGGTGSGKTTLLNVLSAFIPADERIVTIEDAAELQLQQPHVVRLETRPANMEGRGGVAQRDLFKNCLRMRPDRIIVGEARGAEALDMLQAMNTGHDGSMTTVHANSPRDALSRIATMVLMSNTNIDLRAINRQIASALNLVIQTRRYPDGVRRIESISEITGMEQEVITMQEIVAFSVRGTTPDGKPVGAFKLYAVRPRFLERAKELGVSLTQTLEEFPFAKGEGKEKP